MMGTNSLATTRMPADSQHSQPMLKNDMVFEQDNRCQTEGVAEAFSLYGLSPGSYKEPLVPVSASPWNSRVLVEDNGYYF